MHVVLVSDDPRLADPGSEAFARHAAYAAGMAARRPGAVLSVIVPGNAGPRSLADMRACTAPPNAVTAQSPWSARAWRLATRWRVPFLAQLHFDPFAPVLSAPADRARLLLARVALLRAARVRVMVPATAARLGADWGVAPGRIWVAPVPIAWPHDGACAREALVVGAMRLAPDRTPADWLAAARAIHAARPGCRFVLAGDGPLRPALLRAAAGMPIVLPGELDAAALAGLLASASLFLHTARHEAFGRAMVEAQAVGLPVVARTTTGAAHVVRDGITGLLAESDAALADAAIALLADPRRRAAMGAAAREHARSSFEPALMTARVVDFLLGERTVAEVPCATC
jgi:glycosyltransferase involved in cell wall biosynthesis